MSEDNLNTEGETSTLHKVESLSRSKIVRVLDHMVTCVFLLSALLTWLADGATALFYVLAFLGLLSAVTNYWNPVPRLLSAITNSKNKKF